MADGVPGSGVDTTLIRVSRPVAEQLKQLAERRQREVRRPVTVSEVLEQLLAAAAGALT